MLSLGVECGWFLRTPGQMFDQLPSNATAMEGSSANFSCTVLSEDSSTQVNSIWGIQVSGKIVHLGENDNVTMDDLNGSGTACIETPFNSPLTIANITRSLDGTRVRCFFIQKFHRNVTLVSQDMPYAFLTVQCELFNVYTVHYSCCNIKQLTYCQHPDPNPNLNPSTRVVEAGNVLELLSWF